MNLFINPSLNELRNLLSRTNNETDIHHIVVDYDGEVLIDPELQQPDLNLDRFKFKVNLYDRPKNFIKSKSNKLRALFNSLMAGWEAPLDAYNAKGAVN